METLFRDFLREYSDLTEHIPATKIHSGNAPQNTEPPYITVWLVSKPRGQHGTRWSRLQVSLFDTVYGRGKQIAGIIENAIEDFDGGFAQYNENQVDIWEDTTGYYHTAIDGIFYEQEKQIFNL